MEGFFQTDFIPCRSGAAPAPQVGQAMDNGSATGGALPHAGHHGPIAPDSIMAHRMRQAINDRAIKRKGYTDAAHPGWTSPTAHRNVAVWPFPSSGTAGTPGGPAWPWSDLDQAQRTGSRDRTATCPVMPFRRMSRPFRSWRSSPSGSKAAIRHWQSGCRSGHRSGARWWRSCKHPPPCMCPSGW